VPREPCARLNFPGAEFAMTLPATPLDYDPDAEFDLQPEAPRSARMPAMEPSATSREWQLGLIEMLSKLETLRLQMTGCRFTTDATMILDHIEAMVQVTEEFSKPFDFPDSSTDTQMNSLAKAGTFYAALTELRKTTNGSRSLLHSMISKLATAETPVSAQVVLNCLNLGIDCLHTYFSLFTEMFRSSIKARNWVDAASAFLADFKQMPKAFAAG
jgi:hypothetical protein